MNTWDIILTVGIAAIITAAVFAIVKRRKSGKDCCGNCTQCNRNHCNGHCQ